MIRKSTFRRGVWYRAEVTEYRYPLAPPPPCSAEFALTPKYLYFRGSSGTSSLGFCFDVEVTIWNRERDEMTVYLENSDALFHLAQIRGIK